MCLTAFCINSIMGEDAFNTFLSSATLAATPFTIFAHRVLPI